MPRMGDAMPTVGMFENDGSQTENSLDNHISGSILEGSETKTGDIEMACEYEAAGYTTDFKYCARVEAELTGKTWRSHRAVANDLKPGECIYVRDTTGALAGFIRQIRVVSEGKYTISKMPLTEI